MPYSNISVLSLIVVLYNLKVCGNTLRHKFLIILWILKGFDRLFLKAKLICLHWGFISHHFANVYSKRSVLSAICTFRGQRWWSTNSKGSHFSWWVNLIAIYQHHFILKSVLKSSRTPPQCDTVSQLKENTNKQSLRILFRANLSHWRYHIVSFIRANE